LAIVDIRDLAHAFVLALQSKEAEGRFLISSQVWTLTRICEYYKELHPGKKLPTVSASKILLTNATKLFGKGKNDDSELVFSIRELKFA
jgi:nucleoside-diphosphate-sugar epimerase